MSGKVDILFINPSLSWQVDLDSKLKSRIEDGVPNQETPHIGIAYLLADAKVAGYRAKYIDMIMDKFSAQDVVDYIGKVKPFLVGFTAMTIQIDAAAEIAAQIKDKFPDTKICVGGVHVIALPQETLAQYPIFDFVVFGEGDTILAPILNALGGTGRLADIPGVVTRETQKIVRNTIVDVDSLPFPAWEGFDLKKYPGTYPHRTNCELPIIVGRGCPFQCVFCCRSMGSHVRQRSVDSVIGEIERNIRDFSCQSIAFLDETFLIDLKWFDRFVEIFMKKGLHKKIKWSCSTRVDNITPSLLEKMKKSGCYYIFFGIESADDATLKLIKKNITVEQIRDAVKYTKRAGIFPVGAFIIGLPGDTESHVMKDIAMAQELDMYSVTFPIAVPFPGTALRDWALRSEFGMKIISDNWRHYGKQDPGVMESEQLPWSKRKELQRLAYLRNPKHKISAYSEKLTQLNLKDGRV